MNYTVVKQFYNSFIDSIYNLIFKIADFGKMLWEVFLAFLELWEIFFSIFANLFMYIYYLILFSIDRSLDTNPFPKRGGVKERYTPGKLYTGGAFRGRGRSYSSGSRKTYSSSSANFSRTSRAPSGAKTSFIKEMLKNIGDFFREFFNSISGFLKRLTGSVPDLKGKGKRDQNAPQSKGLIDEYLREYEQSRKL